MKRRHQRLDRTQHPARNSNGSHLLIDVSNDGHVQVVSHWIQAESSSSEAPELITNIVNAPPLHPTLFDGTFRYDRPSMDTESEWSLSTETDPSEESESEMSLEEVDSRPVFSVPVIEPSSNDRMESRKQSISVVGNVRGHAVGAMIDPESTVLMQLSRGNVCGHSEVIDCMREVNETLSNRNSIVILKYPSVEDSQGSRRMRVSHKETAKNMMELTEDVLRRVQGSSRESILMKLQRTLGEILYQPEDTIVVHSFSKEDMGKAKSEAFVGYFSRDDEAAVFVQIPKPEERTAASFSDSEDEEQMSVDRLRSFLRESLQGQEDIMEQTLETEPELTISKSGDIVVGVMSFPNASSAVVKTTVQNFPVEQDRSELVQSMKDLTRSLVHQSSGKLLVQIHSNGDRSSKVEQIKTNLDESLKSGPQESDGAGISVRESDDKVIGVLSYSGGSIVIQTSSKNWIKADPTDSPRNLLKSIRLLIEQFITNNELNDVDLRSLAAIISQAFHCPRVDLTEEFLSKHVLQKIPFVVHKLMNPSDSEDAFSIINQIREILEDISKTNVTGTRPKDFNYQDLLKSYFDELICEENTQFDNDSIILALREVLLNVLIHYEASLSSSLEELLELLKLIPAENIELHSPSGVISCPGTTNLTEERLHLDRFPSDSTSLEVFQRIHNLLVDEEPLGGREVSYISTFQNLFLTLLKLIAGWSLRVKSFLDKEPQQAILVESESEPEPEPDPSLSKKPSVSFHLIQTADSNEETPSDISQQLQKERQQLNNAIDDLRQFLEKSLNVPDTWEQERKGSQMEFQGGSAGVKHRMFHLFSQLLDEAGKMKVTDRSRDSIHLRLDTASGELERKEGEQFVVLNGSIRDRKHNLGLFFDARMVNLRDASSVESEVECLKEIRRLSDDSEEIDVGALLPGIVESCLADVGSEKGNDDDIQTGGEAFRLQESLSRYFELIQNYIQESIEPMRETLGVILEKVAAAGTDKIRDIRSSFIQNDYNVEMQNIREEVALEEVEEVTHEAKSVQCAASVANQSVQNNDDLNDYPSRFHSVESELRELKEQLKDLCSILRAPVAPDFVKSLTADSIARSQTASFPSTETSKNGSLLTTVDPSAPTLEEIEGRLSITVEIVPDSKERKPSQVSDTSNLSDEFSSAIECLGEVEGAEEPPRMLDVSRKSSEIVPLRALTVEIPCESAFVQRSRRSQDSHDVNLPRANIQAATLEEQLPLPVDFARSSVAVAEQIRLDKQQGSTDDSTKIVDEELDDIVQIFEEPAEKVTSRRSMEEQLPMIISSGAVAEQCRSYDQRRSTVVRSAVADEGRRDSQILSIEDATESVPSRRSLKEQLPSIRSSGDAAEQPRSDDQRRSTIVPSEVVNERGRDNQILSNGEPNERVPSRRSLNEQLTRSSGAVAKQPPSDEQRRSAMVPTEVADEGSRSRILSFEEPAQRVSSRSLNEQLKLPTESVAVESVTAEIVTTEGVTAESVTAESVTAESVTAVTEQPRLNVQRRSSMVPTEVADEGRDSPTLSFEEPAERVSCTKSLEEQLPLTVESGRSSEAVIAQVRLDDPRRVSRMVQTSPKGSLKEVDQRRRSTTVSIEESVTSKRVSEQHPRLSRNSVLELDEIPVRDGEKSNRGKPCDLALSYKCRWADEEGRKFVCPVEIYSCHPVGHNQLMVHWEVAPQFLEQISGYQIYVDGNAYSICYSRRRRTGLIEEIDLRKQHRIAIYCTPETSVCEQVQWAPGIFLYHL